MVYNNMGLDFIIEESESPLELRRKIVINGGLTLSNTGELKDRLIGLLEDKRPMSLTINVEEGIDMSGIQLLLALKKALHKQAFNAELQVQFSPDQQLMLKSGGLWEELSSSDCLL